MIPKWQFVILPEQLDRYKDYHLKHGHLRQQRSWHALKIGLK